MLLGILKEWGGGAPAVAKGENEAISELLDPGTHLLPGDFEAGEWNPALAVVGGFVRHVGPESPGRFR